MSTTDTLKLAREALELIAGTDPVDAALDPQRAVRVAREALAALSAAPAGEPVATIHVPADLVEYMRDHLKRVRFTLDGFVALGNELSRAAKYDRWIAALAAPAPAEPAVPAWQPIETAPKDAVVLLAAEFDCPGDWRIKCGTWIPDEKAWRVWGASWIPTRWMPLPAPPATPVA